MSAPEFLAIDNPDETVTITRGALVNLALAAERGEALGAWISITAMLGHSRPGHSLDYVSQGQPWTADSFVRDFVAWTSGREKFAPGCGDRLREWGLAEAGLRSESVLRKLGVSVPAEEKAA